MHSNRLNWLAGGVLTLSGTTCGVDTVGIGVTVKNLPPDAAALFVSSSLDGGSSKQSVVFSQQLSHFTIRVPVSKLGSGQLVLSGSALASDRCKLSTGRSDVTLRSDNTYTEVELSLVPLASKLCTQLAQVSPPVGPTAGGVSLSIDGQNFSEGTTVTVAGLPATNVQVVSPTKLTATLPGMPTTVGKVAVAVLTPEGGTATRSDLFAYYQLDFQPTAFPVGQMPSAIAAGDFNADGKKDVVVSNYNSANVGVLLGNGLGGLGSMQSSNSATGSCPRAMAVNDYNQDGKQDLIVVNECSNNVSVMFGANTGTFINRVEYSIDSAASNVPNAVALGDFNGDTRLDLAVTNLNNKNVGILLGTATGTFTGLSNITVSATPMGVATGDFNTDGAKDLAVSLFGGNSVAILKNSGSGLFSVTGTYPVTSKADFVTVGDFNADGKLDLAVANNGAPVVSILAGNGDGTFATAKSFQVGDTPYSIVVGDFTGDGRADLAVANHGSNSVSVLVGDGAGGFSAASSFAAGKNPTSIASSDFNSDGQLDLVVSNGGDDTVTLLLNRSR